LKSHFDKCGAVKYADVRTCTPITGQVRFDTPEKAQAAVALAGTVLEGHEIAIKLHAGSKDRTKVQVFNIPSHLEWQELKDFFVQKGITPVFCETCSSESTGAEVRYDDPQHAQDAVNALDGGILGGAEIRVAVDQTSTDGSKLIVTNVPAGIEWQELKDHFGQCGTVAFVKTRDKGAGKGRFGKGKGGWSWVSQQAMQRQMQEMMAQMQAMQRGGKGLGGGKGADGGGLTGEVRFHRPQGALKAVKSLNGSTFKGCNIAVGLDQTSQDFTKVWVSGLPIGTDWRELKEYFATAGQVEFADSG